MIPIKKNTQRIIYIYIYIYISPEQRQKIIDDLTIYYNIIMKYQKIINLLDDRTNQPSKFRTENCVEINDESQ